MSTRPGKTYEMQWDCQFCGTKKLLGKTHRFCPNCGAPQNPAARYYPDDSEKVAVEDHVFVGADLTCAKCGQLNAGNSEFCQQCGAPLTDAAQAKTLAAEVKGAQGFAAAASRDVTKEAFDAEMQRVGVQKKKVGGFNWKLWAVIGVVAVVIIGIIAALTITKEATVVVSGFEWSREIHVEEYGPFTEQSWWNVRPSGDNVIKGLCHDEARGSHQEADGEECSTSRVDNGDGTYSEQESCHTKYRTVTDYDSMCTWTGFRWQPTQSINTQGTSKDPAPFWGDATFSCSSSTVGCQREAGRDEVYNLVLKNDKGVEYRCALPQDEWTAAGMESVWTVKVRVVDQNAADCGTLKQK